jgi:hypothetical protein
MDHNEAEPIARRVTRTASLSGTMPNREAHPPGAQKSKATNCNSARLRFCRPTRAAEQKNCAYHAAETGSPKNIV